MKDMNVSKNVDAAWRISIPKEVREAMGIEKGDTFDFYLGEGFLRGGKDTIILKKSENNEEK